MPIGTPELSPKTAPRPGHGAARPPQGAGNGRPSASHRLADDVGMGVGFCVAALLCDRVVGLRAPAVPHVAGQRPAFVVNPWSAFPPMPEPALPTLKPPQQPPPGRRRAELLASAAVVALSTFKVGPAIGRQVAGWWQAGRGDAPDAPCT